MSMPFERVIGQQRIKHFFERAIKNKRLSHAYLFVGQSGVGKETMAIDLARKLLSPGGSETNPDKRVAALTHPDFEVLFPAPAKINEDERQNIKASIVENPYHRQQPWANPSISIASIREIKRKAAYKSFEGNGRVIVIFDCERLTIEAANSLLKILEEPPDKMYIIMTTANPSQLLPTIKSRCQVVKFDPLPVTLIEETLLRQGFETGKARLAARLASGSYKRSLEILGDDLQKGQAAALEFFRKSIQSNYLQLFYVEELMQRFQRDLKGVKELLSNLLIWFRDAMIYRESEESALTSLIHIEQVEVLKNFNNNFPNADLSGAMREIERSLELLGRNVQANLILIVLLNNLRTFVAGR